MFIIINFKDDSSYGLAIGLALVFFAFFYIINLVRSSEKSQDRIKLEIARRSKSDPINRIKLNDSKLIYESKDVKVEMSWSVFQCYKIYKDSIFFILTSYLDSYVVRKIDMSDTEFSEILAFISRTLPEKK